jgi:hypothetical protein
MKLPVFLRVLLVGFGCLGIAAGAVAWLMEDDSPEARRPPRPAPSSAAEPSPAGSAIPPFPDPRLPSFPDPSGGPGDRVFVDPFAADAGVFLTAARSTPPVRDDRSLREYRRAIGGRGSAPLAALQGEIDGLKLDEPPTFEQALRAIDVQRRLAFVHIYEGRYDEATARLRRARELAKTEGLPPEVRAHLTALLGIVALRRGEQENCIGCVGPSSCIFPIAPAAVHTRPQGSREAVEWFTAYLDEWPGDLRIRWLLNVAAMTLGEHPDGVPPRHRLPLAPFRSKTDIGRFPNVALAAGVASRGPDLAGGSLFDDLDGDDRPDLFVTSFEATHGAAFYHNNGDGTFEDRSAAAGLDEQVYALNAARADYDNDGHLDILLLRGGWEKPAPLSLLHNEGDGTFRDATAAAGLGEPIATEAAAWGDFDDDGLIDLYVCGEYTSLDPETGRPSSEPSDPRNHSRLYRNSGDGTFEDVAARAGVQNNRWAKGCAWADFDNDGRLDLFVSNMDARGRLYHNEGRGTFRDVALEMGLDTPPRGFTCLAWDYDNDGWQDLLVTDFGASLAGVVAAYLGLPAEGENRPRLFRNEEGRGFREVSREVGLTQPLPCMSVNCGDIDNDGDLDLHLGTGWMTLSGLVPDVMYLNAGGRFEDVTESTGTGHLQKGHGVSFADYDADGDLDLFVVLGGGYPGDQGYSALFRNPGHGRHWLKVKLVGTRSNRAALGARLRAEVERADGSTRTIHRLIGNNGSFGGNSLVEHLGLGEATSLARLTITWPASGTEQTFDDLPADRFIEITEGAEDYRTIDPPVPEARY